MKFEVFVIDGDFLDFEDNPMLSFVVYKAESFDKAVTIAKMAIESGLQVVISPARRGDGQT